MTEEEKNAAKTCFDEAKRKCRKVTFYDVTAPYVMLAVLPFVKWEAEELPKLFRKWDNEVSLNGDRALEWNSDGSRKPVPLEDTPEVRSLAYYAQGITLEVSGLDMCGWGFVIEQATLRI